MRKALKRLAVAPPTFALVARWLLRRRLGKTEEPGFRSALADSGSAQRHDARAERLRATGVETSGTVLSLMGTGATMSHNPLVRIRVRIEPVEQAAAPLEAEQPVFVSRTTIPRPGDRVPVLVNPADPSDWAFPPGTFGVTFPGRLSLLRHNARDGLEIS